MEERSRRGLKVELLQIFGIAPSTMAVFVERFMCACKMQESNSLSQSCIGRAS